jgi:CheY-like chemotaxis protein
MKAVGGVVLDEAGDGAEAVRLVREGAYDLILTDRQMPVMDGHEVRGLVRAATWRV